LHLINGKAEVLACDLHPKFTTTALAKEWAESNGLPLVRVQHHHAHAAALMTEHGLDEIVGVIVTATVMVSTEKHGAAKSSSAKQVQQSLGVLDIWSLNHCWAETWQVVSNANCSRNPTKSRHKH
jgi:hydrogenase maturation factor HypF (carbamoyltransferase family)